MKFSKYVLIFTVIVACNRQHNIFTNNDFGKAIDDYIQENPLNLPITKNIYEDGFSYPSYQIYFREKNEDTLMSIIQTPHLTKVEIIDSYINQNEIIYKLLEPDGFLMYKNKYPLILFNSENYIESDLRKTLIQKIPDSLKFNKINVHFKNKKWNYRMKNGKWVVIEPDSSDM